MSKIKSDESAKTTQSATHHEGTSRDDQINLQTGQRNLLIWLDANIDVKKKYCQNVIAQLRGVASTLNTFTDEEQCAQFLNVTKEERVYMIISGTLTQNIVPRIHSMPQLVSIFVFCDNRQHYERWAKAWFKIKGFFTEIKPLCEAVKQVSSQYDGNTVSNNAMNTAEKLVGNSLHPSHPSFMYSKILVEILINTNYEPHSVHEFARYCRESQDPSEGQLRQIDELEERYRDHTAIWWYISNTFLYPIVSRALRTLDVDLIIKLGFFICDIHRQIERLHEKQFGSYKSNQNFTVYRGQGMAKEEFKKLVADKSGLLSFNNFLSTSKDREIALFFGKSCADIPDLVGVLFVIKIDPARFTTPFALTADVSVYGETEEVLFSTHTVFRIGNISQLANPDNVIQIELTSINDNVSYDLTGYIKENTFLDEIGCIEFGATLVKMGQFEKAQQIYELLLTRTIKESAKVRIYNQLGMIKVGIGEYSKGLSFYDKALAIQQQSLPPSHPDLALSNISVGMAYLGMANCVKAHSYFTKALSIQQKSLPSNHPDIAFTHDNIGLAYKGLMTYSKARPAFELAIDIAQQSLPSNHPDLEKYRKHLAEVNEKL